MLLLPYFQRSLAITAIPFLKWECKGKGSYVSYQNFLLFFLQLWREIQYVLLRTAPTFLGGRQKYNDCICPPIFTVIFLHIQFNTHPHLKNFFIETGGKDRGRIVVTKCFLKPRNYKRTNPCAGMRSEEKLT